MGWPTLVVPACLLGACASHNATTLRTPHLPIQAADVMDCTILNLWNVNTGDNGTVAVMEAIIEAGEENQIWKIDLGAY